MSSINKIKSKGPIWLPWGTPYGTEKVIVVWLNKLTYCERCDKKELNQDKRDESG